MYTLGLNIDYHCHIGGRRALVLIGDKVYKKYFLKLTFLECLWVCSALTNALFSILTSSKSCSRDAKVEIFNFRRQKLRRWLLPPLEKTIFLLDDLVADPMKIPAISLENNEIINTSYFNSWGPLKKKFSQNSGSCSNSDTSNICKAQQGLNFE